MVAFLTIALLALLANVVTHVRSAEAELSRWRRRTGLNTVAAMAAAERAGLRVRWLDVLAADRRRLGELAMPAPLIVAWISSAAGHLLGWPTAVTTTVGVLLLLPQTGVVTSVRAAFTGRLAAHRRTGAFLLALAALLLVAGGIGVLSWAAGRPAPTAAAGALGAFALLAAAGPAARVSRRWSLQSELSEDLVASKTDAVYLRSFRDDALVLRGPDPSVGALAWLLGGRIRFEQLLASPFGLPHAAGRMLAIGRPGESLPALGAVRTYTADDEWQATVARLVDRAGVVVVVAGTTRGLDWELQHLSRSGLLRKTVVLLPPLGEKATFRRWSTLIAQMGIDFSGTTSADGVWVGVLLRMMTAIGFTTDGRPVLYVAEHRDWWAYSQTLVHAVGCITGSVEPPLHGEIARTVDPGFPLDLP